MSFFRTLQLQLNWNIEFINYKLGSSEVSSFGLRKLGGRRPQITDFGRTGLHGGLKKRRVRRCSVQNDQIIQIA